MHTVHQTGKNENVLALACCQTFLATYTNLCHAAHVPVSAVSICSLARGDEHCAFVVTRTQSALQQQHHTSHGL